MAPLMLFMALISPEGLPLTGHTWLDNTFGRVVRWLLNWLTGGTKIVATDLVTFKALPANVYANGTAGVGATLTASGTGALTIDGVAVSVGLLVGVWGEAAPANNGLYRVTNPGGSGVAYVLTRDTSFNASALVMPGTRFGVRSGTVYAGLTYEYTGVVSPTMGTTALTAMANTKLVRNAGVIPGSRLPFTVQPTATNTLVIGGQTFIFVAALGATTANTQVLIAGSAALTLVNLINAINGDATSKGTTWAEATVPFSISIFADAQPATALRIRGARARGGDPVPSNFPTTALSTTIAGGGAWTNDNLSLIGKADTDTLETSGVIVVDAAHITAAGLAAGLTIELGFTPKYVSWEVITAAGVGKWTVTDTLVPVAGGMQFNTAGATHVVAGDTIVFWAQQ